jgi:hypothetical protein
MPQVHFKTFRALMGAIDGALPLVSDPELADKLRLSASAVCQEVGPLPESFRLQNLGISISVIAEAPPRNHDRRGRRQPDLWDSVGDEI